MTIVHHTKALPFSHIENARQLGGYRTKDNRFIKHNVLLRTAHLANIDANDIETLQHDYHLHTIIDFRSKAEIQAKPDKQIDGVNHIVVPIIPELNSQDNLITHSDDEVERALKMIQRDLMMDTFYIHIIQQDVAKKGYRKFFDILLDVPDNSSVLWHCTAGKDRTGLAAYFLMTILGVDEQTCMDDYLLTNVFVENKIAYMIENLLPLSSDIQNAEVKIRSMFGTLESIMQNCVDYCKQQYGGVLGYLQEEVGITDEEIQILRQKYLTSTV